MNSKTNPPWVKINDFLLDLGEAQTSSQICISAFHSIDTMVAFDIAALYILDDSLKPVRQFLAGIEPMQNEDYLNYYSKLHGGRFFYANIRPGEMDWDEIEDCEFKRDYIRPQRVRNTANFMFYSADGWPKACLTISRTSHSDFTPAERETLSIIRRHLTNLYGIFSNAAGRREEQHFKGDVFTSLTRRQSEIVALLARGMSPAQISQRVHISLHTVYKHLAHIYKKNEVSSQRELLAKVVR